jgi:predicted PurR-regulated permease PerM
MAKMKSERQLLFWLAVALVFVVAILALQEVLLPFVTGIVLAYAFNPLADKLDRMGLPRVVAAGLVVALIVAIIAGLLVFVVPLLIVQLQELAANLPGELERLKGLIEAWAREQFGDRFAAIEQTVGQGLVDFSANWASVAQFIASSLLAQGQAVINFLALLLITPVVLFYVLADWNGMIAQIDRWLPRAHQSTLRRLASRIDEAISAFIRGQGLVCVILGIYYTVTLSFAGLSYGLLVGLLTGVLSFVPFVGWATGLILSATLALIQGWPDPTLLFFVLAIFAGSQALDAAFLSPKIVGSRIGLHPVWLIFALIVFSYLFGMVGVLVAVPLAAAVGVLVRFALEVYLASGYYTGGTVDDDERLLATEPPPQQQPSRGGARPE